jgi:large subunit ribosomal protein L19
MDVIRKTLEARHARKNLPDFRAGDVVRVREKVREGGKERVAMFEGLVIARKHGAGLNGTFTVRRVISGMGVERIFPLHSPHLERIEIIKRTRVRRAKLYYVRRQMGRRVRRRKDIAVPGIRAVETTASADSPEKPPEAEAEQPNN